jgi:AraC family transcriptional regulator
VLHQRFQDTAADDAAAADLVGRRPARWTDVRRMETPSLTAMVVDYERDFPAQGVWRSNSAHYYDLALSARSIGSRGRFPSEFSDFQSLGKLFLAPAGLDFEGAGGEGRQQSLYVFVRANPLFDDAPELGEASPQMLRNCLHLESEAIRQPLFRIARELCEPSFASKLLVEGLGLTILAETVRLFRSEPFRRARKGGLPGWRMKLIEERLRCDDPQPTLVELAELCGLSRRQFTRAFREETGQTVSSYLQDLTIQRAKTLLSQTDEPIHLIAAKVGFACASSFTIAFSRATGSSPRTYRHALHARRRSAVRAAQQPA